MSSINPRKWRFTWEAQCHAPILKLFLFHSVPLEWHNLNVQVHLGHSVLLLTWTEEEEAVEVGVPIPGVLIDEDCPVGLLALDDHIEVKLPLLLPVNHPILSSFNSSSHDVVVESDLESLSSSNEGVHFYCTSCFARLTTTPLTRFVEMPSVNWREVADNWFGGCCCSFGGASEKMINKYAGAYKCEEGVCLLDASSVTVCKDDLVECNFSGCKVTQTCKLRLRSASDVVLHKEATTTDVGIRMTPRQDDDISGVNGKCRALSLCCEDDKQNDKHGCTEENVGRKDLLCAQSDNENLASAPGCCDSTCSGNACINEVADSKPLELMSDQRSFLDGFLGDVFMAKSYNRSANIAWRPFVCPQCSSILGAYPCATSDVPVDSGVRFFKCYISTSSDVDGSGNLFRKYTLERMFTNHLVGSAKDELSFRTVVRDMATKSPILQVVLINPDMWFCSGICSDNGSTKKLAPKLELLPAIKIVFSDCSKYTESQLRELEDWVAKNDAEEIFMIRQLIEELIHIMVSKREAFPPSCTSLQGLSLSCLFRNQN